MSAELWEAFQKLIASVPPSVNNSRCVSKSLTVRGIGLRCLGVLVRWLANRLVLLFRLHRDRVLTVRVYGRRVLFRLRWNAFVALSVLRGRFRRILCGMVGGLDVRGLLVVEARLLRLRRRICTVPRLRGLMLLVVLNLIALIPLMVLVRLGVMVAVSRISIGGLGPLCMPTTLRCRSKASRVNVPRLICCYETRSERDRAHRAWPHRSHHRLGPARTRLAGRRRRSGSRSRYLGGVRQCDSDGVVVRAYQSIPLPSFSEVRRRRGETSG